MLKDQTRAPRCLAPKVAHVPESSAELNESPFQRCTCNIEMLTDWNFAHLPLLIWAGPRPLAVRFSPLLGAVVARLSGPNNSPGAAGQAAADLF